MAEALNTTRRTLIKAFPFIGAAIAMPIGVAEAAKLIGGAPDRSVPASAAELFEHHFAGLVAALNETAGECDGWSLQCGFRAADPNGTWHKAQRYWNREEMIGGRLLPTAKIRDFDPLTGASTDWRDLGYSVSSSR